MERLQTPPNGGVFACAQVVQIIVCIISISGTVSVQRNVHVH